MFIKILEHIPWKIRRYLENKGYGYTIHSSVCFGKHVRIENRENKLSIGKSTNIGSNTLLDLTQTVTIGNGVQFGPGVIVTTHDSSMQPVKKAPVVIEDNAYVGAGAIILMGTTIGRNAIVGAGAVVTKNVPRATTVVGIPAQKLQKKAGIP
jgi:acetyltransferase-like isoleucine patch superfamily enzyme